MANIIFVGNGKQVSEKLIGVSICIDDIKAAREYYTTGKNGKQYLSLNITRKDSADQWGKTHAVSVNTWRPGDSQKHKQDDWNSPVDENEPF